MDAQDIVLYQYSICPFCNKVKSLLDLYGIAYHVVEVNPLTKGELRAVVRDYRKVPVARIGGEVVTDSPRIVERLRACLSEAGAGGDAAVFGGEALSWAAWADERLAVLLFPNITRSWSEAYQAFRYVNAVPTFGALDRAANLAVGSTAMWLAQGRLKRKYGIEDERGALYAAVAEWEGALEASGGAFAGGAAPHMGDVAVFGALRAIEGMDAHRDILENTALGPWYARMRALVGDGSCRGFQ